MWEQRFTLGALRRGAVMLTALFLLFAFLLTRVFLIQLFDFERYQQKVVDQLTTSSPVRAARGEILDAAGRVLATTRTVYRISVYPSLIAKAGEETAALVIEGLAATTGIPADTVRDHLSHTRELSRTVVRETDSTVASAVIALVASEGLGDLIAVEAVPDRYYPNGSLAAQVLGFTGSDGQGLYGLELQYDTVLSGVAGAYITARDSTGNRLPNRYEAYVPATDGCTLQTTLDAYVQAVLEEQLEATMIESAAENRACGIVMDVQTGAVLAIVCRSGSNS